eukprot:maker-scaffold321_size207582-snap-gene-1.24 protein:Tk05189 transcript:maker-scaffold321_size207582-snap-gene-1.24-mRNA-1 annotation:"leucine-rich repeat-containing protein 55"
MGTMRQRFLATGHSQIGWAIRSYFLLWLLTATHVSAFCPKKCTCSPNEIVCRNQKLLEIPPELLALGDSGPDLKNFTKLDLSQNRLNAIPPGFLLKFPNLQEVHLDSNGISKLAGDTFQGTQIHTLSLSNNEFLDIPFDALQSLPSLISLGLERNIIRGLGENRLAGFKRLKEIKLEYNQISSVSVNAFKPVPNLREL